MSRTPVSLSDPVVRRRVAAVAAALLLGFVLLWARTDRLHIARSDFSAAYCAATLVREGHASQIYNDRAEGALHLLLAAPDVYPVRYTNPPAAVLPIVPSVGLTLIADYRLWSMLELLALAAAALVAARVAPGPATGGARLTAALVGLASVGSGDMLLTGQWDGVTALGLALPYWAWRRGRPATGGFLLGFLLCLAKPHLGIGLAAFLVGRRDWRALGGAATGAGAVAALSLAVTGPGGIIGLARELVTGATAGALRTMSSAAGIVGWLQPDATAGRVLLGVVAAALAGVCLVLGRRSAQGLPLEPTLGCAAVLSLLASPHAYVYDLAVAVPVVAWSVARYADQGRGMVLAAAWALVNVAAYLDVVDGGSLPPGAWGAWGLAVFAILLWRLGTDRPSRLAGGWAAATAVDSSA